MPTLVKISEKISQGHSYYIFFLLFIEEETKAQKS